MKVSYWGVLLVSLSIVFIVVRSIRIREKGKANFDRFYNSNLNGKISNIEISVGVTYIRLFPDNQQYSFIPITSSSNQNKPFNSIARNGDYVIKPAQSDTLKLVIGEDVYLYTFKKL